MKKNLRIFFAFACLIVSIFCTSVSAEVASVPKLNKTSASMIVGKKLTLKVSNTKKKVTWSSSNKKIATVTTKGVVKAVKAGKANITAKVSGKKLVCKVTVKNADADATELTVTGENGGDFVAGEGKVEVNFKLNATSTAVKAKILNSSEETVYTKTFSQCKANKAYKFTWNGKDKSGDYIGEGLYTVRIIAGAKQTNSEYIYFYEENEFAGGNGSENNPYEVSSTEQLEAVAKHNGMHFVQTADIDFNYGSFVGLFTSDVPFTGVYDGGNYTIKNIINTSTMDYYAIFRAVGKEGVVKNVVADACSYKGNYRVAIIVGYNSGTITDCVVKNCFVTSSANTAGVICGSSEGVIKSCEVSNNAVSGGEQYTGAICGYNSGVIQECVSSRDSINGMKQYVGGITGYNKGNIINCKVQNNTLYSDYRAYEVRVGGITGYNSGTISACEVYDTENLISAYPSYALCGLGGICGINIGNSVNNVYYGSLSQNGHEY